MTKKTVPKILLALALVAALIAVGAAFLPSGMLDDEGESLCRANFAFSRFHWFFDRERDLYRTPYGYDFFKQQPLFYALLWAWKNWIGSSKAALRILPFLSYALSALLFLGICFREKLSAGRAALLTAWLVTVPTFVFYGYYIREYSLLCLTATFSLYAFLELMDSAGARRGRALAAFLLSGAAAAAVSFAFFGPLGLMVAAVFRGAALTPRQRRALAGASLLLLAFFLKKAYEVSHSLIYLTPPETVFHFPNSTFVGQLAGFIASPSPLIWPAAAVSLAVALMVFARAWRSGGGARSLVLIAFAAVGMALLLKAWNRFEVGPRYICFIIPLFPLVEARLGRGTKALHAAIALLILCNLAFLARMRHDPILTGEEPEVRKVEPGLASGQTTIYTDQMDLECQYGIYFNTLFQDQRKSLEFKPLAELPRPVPDPLRVFVMEANERAFLGQLAPGRRVVGRVPITTPDYRLAYLTIAGSP